ncbi:MAG: hypothetical protein EOO23_06260 [Comamonadaceae bacterium]|nr:MAG: hypothetical protein EOO23_06260 [Comamonadaceae bacterium]
MSLPETPETLYQWWVTYPAGHTRLTNSHYTRAVAEGKWERCEPEPLSRIDPGGSGYGMSPSLEPRRRS